MIRATGPLGNSAPTTSSSEHVAVSGNRPRRTRSVPGDTNTHNVTVTAKATTAAPLSEWSLVSSAARRRGDTSTAAAATPTINSPALVSLP